MYITVVRANLLLPALRGLQVLLGLMFFAKGSYMYAVALRVKAVLDCRLIRFLNSLEIC